MAESQTDPKRIKKLITDLEAREERIVIGALKCIPHEGNHEVIRPMLLLLSTNPSADIQLLLEKSLFNLKDPKAVDPLLDALTDKELLGIRSEILACIWQSGIEVNEHLSLLIDIAISDEFMTAVEVLTIVDNGENYPDDQLTESIKKLDDSIVGKSDKTALLGNLRQILLEKLLD
ncbi:hypothetical protein OAA53_01330 [Salibacteraceae bacterium]|nr:hypothetical protein [Salibacteraceae bacterium]